MRKPHPIKIYAASGNEGDVVRVQNLTKAVGTTVTLDSNKKAIVDLANLGSWEASDKIMVYITGKQVGGSILTVSGGSTTGTLTTAAYAGPSVSM